MRLVVTGTPGVGKTTIATLLAQKLGLSRINETAFAQKQGIGRTDRKTNERVVPLGRLTKALNQWLQQHANAVVEGHLVCECRLRPIDWVIVVRLNPERLEFRLRERHYSEVKIQDNVMCEGIDYCLKHTKRNYPLKKIVEIQNDKSLKQTIARIVKMVEAKP